MEFYFSLRVYLRYHFLVIYENVNCYNVLRGIGVGEQLLITTLDIETGRKGTSAV